jgi:hypothetical protein
MTSNPENFHVNMRLSPMTVEKIQEIQDSLAVPNRTQAIVYAVNLAREIINSIKKGGKVYIENQDGSKERLIVIGH